VNSTGRGRSSPFDFFPSPALSGPVLQSESRRLSASGSRASPLATECPGGKRISDNNREFGKGERAIDRPAGEKPSWEAISSDLTITHRDLPHWQVGGATYFITFRLKGHRGGTGVSPVQSLSSPLTAPERTIVREAILFWHERKWFVHALTVMPDHVHILATPRERSPGAWFSLAELMHSVKSFTAHRIRSLRGKGGVFWQSERFDRVSRDQSEFDEKAKYIVGNAQRTGLVADGWEYEWFWSPSKEELQKRRQG